MAAGQTKIKGCRNGRDYFSLGIVTDLGWSFVNEEQALRAWGQMRHSLSYSTKAFPAGLEREQGKAWNKNQ